MPYMPEDEGELIIPVKPKYRDLVKQPKQLSAKSLSAASATASSKHIKNLKRRNQKEGLAERFSKTPNS